MESETRSATSEPTRREVITSVAATIVCLTIEPSLAQASSQNRTSTPCVGLDGDERATYEALAETLLPGAGAAGIVRYLEKQLCRDVSLLFLRYMDYPSLQIDFYKDGLASLNKEAERSWGTVFAAGSEAQKIQLVQSLLESNPPLWQGPPAPLFCFVVRNDAADVYYGTADGFSRLGIPYLPLLQPPTAW
jgi:hypothetical protein